ncbi:MULTISPECIES: nuclear transport factor 2 family protein [unclassified Streptomyces]|uniref:nuclear transport factor 2 family protein n=1 Tax=unclassified Streptomyces TaxID=2593676 RepID=UPI000DAC3B17|nr:MULTISPECIES: nuclear transport factor 2 family protein [unclassified Streptomyces]PZT74780.1 ketosteroid isomerase [Streptomyces sp. AC1-42T]PZT82234.1 ketosteroid isomerase [Streptomyces sp. AC1-42W]WUC93391.1 nuclear transport factor 2 family protein [Streptomyces sp. NBC_00525]
MTAPAMPKAVLQFFDASQKGDVDAWADAFAESGIFHDPVGTEPIKGREAIRAFIASVVPNFDPFLGLTPVEAHTVGSSVAVSWHGSAVSKDGKPVNWSGINVYELGEDGLIHEAKAYFNHAIFQAQLS